MPRHLPTQPEEQGDERLPRRLLLIAPSSGPWRALQTRRFFNGRTFRFSLLSLLSVAVLTPDGVEIRIVDEQVDDIPWSEPWDLVGLTCMTALAPRAYEIAEAFRRKGVPVVLGGVHPTLCPEEAAQHADAIVVGDAEEVWPQVLKDAASGRLRTVYRSTHPPSMSGMPAPPRHLLRRTGYSTIQAIQATRGCPNRCDFCSVAAFHQRSHRKRPVAEVAAEIAALPEDFFIFVDDNLAADRAYARDLVAAVRPLRKRWITQLTLEAAEDREWVARAADAGCVGVFVGLESFQGGSLAAVGKGFNRVERYRHAIQCFHDHGIAVEAGVVFGFDGDTPDVFRRTLESLESLQIDAVQVSILTPLPGTPRFEALRHRIHDRDWSSYDLHHVVFTPAGMTTAQLQAGHDWVTREFYRPWRIIRRIWRHAWRPRSGLSLRFFAAVNLAYLGRVLRWRIQGYDPASRALPCPSLPADFPDTESGPGRRSHAPVEEESEAAEVHARS